MKKFIPFVLACFALSFLCQSIILHSLARQRRFFRMSGFTGNFGMASYRISIPLHPVKPNRTPNPLVAPFVMCHSATQPWNKVNEQKIRQQKENETISRLSSSFFWFSNKIFLKDEANLLEWSRNFFERYLKSSDSFFFRHVYSSWNRRKRLHTVSNSSIRSLCSHFSINSHTKFPLPHWHSSDIETNEWWRKKMCVYSRDSRSLIFPGWWEESAGGDVSECERWRERRSEKMKLSLEITKHKVERFFRRFFFSLPPSQALAVSFISLLVFIFALVPFLSCSVRILSCCYTFFIATDIVSKERTGSPNVFD